MKHVIAIVSAVLIVGMSSNAFAQTASTGDRPATLSTWGDTGLWLVPSGAVLPNGRWAFSFARTESDFGQGFTDVSSFPLSVAYGLGRAEIFGSWRTVTRIDRDTNPLFFTRIDTNLKNEPGGLVNDFPTTRSSWTGSEFGDLLLGGKAALMSEVQQPMALAVRGTVKVPIADADLGVGTGKYDWYLDGIIGKEIARMVDVNGFAGYAWRGNLDDINVSNGYRWGLGTSVPSRGRLRLNAELQGEFLSDSNVVALPDAIVGEDGTVAPVLSSNEDPVNLSVGLTFQTLGGLFFDAGVIYSMHADRAGFRSVANPLVGLPDDTSGRLGLQFKIGWDRGVAAYVPPPPPVAAAPPPPPIAPANQNPAVIAQCNPCTVAPGALVSLRATGQDPDGDTLRYEWSTPTGTINDRTAASSTFNAPDIEGPVLVTVTAEDGKGGIARDTVTITVKEGPVATAGTLQGVRFDDVYFNLDEDTLRVDAMLTLGTVLNAMRGDPTMRLQIAGHACDLGTTEYNLGLSERRAERVRAYFAAQGIDPARITTIAYGEERPQNDNSTEALRRLNRRAVMNATTER